MVVMVRCVCCDGGDVYVCVCGGGGGGGGGSDIVLLTALIAYLLFLFVPLGTAAAAHTVSMTNKQIIFFLKIFFISHP